MDFCIAEKRKHERYILDAPVHVKYVKDSAPEVILGRSKDISSSGVFILSKENPLQKAQSVHLELTLTIKKLNELFGCSKKVTLEVKGHVLRFHQDGFVIKLDKNYSIFPVRHEEVPEYNCFDLQDIERRVGI